MEFVVWDKPNSKFVEDKRLRLNSLGELYYFDDDETFASEKELDMDKFSICWDIGKTDINNKKIYADCSVVEFEYRDNTPIETFKKDTGYFYFDKDLLSFMIKTKRGIYTVKGLENLMIIDTIQENKLGLVG